MTHITLTDPLSIGPRLLPCLDLGGGHRIYINTGESYWDGSRWNWAYIIEANGEVMHEGNDLTAPRIADQSVAVREAFAALTDFLTADADSYGHGNHGEDSIFPEDVAAWAHAHDQELANAAWLLAEEGDR